MNSGQPVDDGRNLGKPTWTVRRRIIISTLLLCAAAIFYIMLWGDDTRVNEAIILGSFGTITMVIGSYVFGAVWSDNTSRTLTNQRSGIMIAPNATVVGSESSAARKKRAKARLARMRQRQVMADNPDG